MTEFEKLKAQKDAILQRQRDEIEGLLEQERERAIRAVMRTAWADAFFSNRQEDVRWVVSKMDNLLAQLKASYPTDQVFHPALSRPSDKEPEGWRPWSTEITVERSRERAECRFVAQSGIRLSVDLQIHQAESLAARLRGTPPPSPEKEA